MSLPSSSLWDRLIDQEQSRQLLRSSACSDDNKQMSHAWLFTGSPGSGRSVAARVFAAALQCEQEDPENRGCGECKSCQLVMEGAHPDVYVLATDKVTIGIEEVRGLIQISQSSPTAGKWRVILVEDTDRMLERTTNVLLKAVEEPPQKTVWLLCAPSVTDVLPTIRSRCRHVQLRVPRPEIVAQQLVQEINIVPELAIQCALEAQSHVGVARRLAQDPARRRKRLQTLAEVVNLRYPSQAVALAQRIVEATKETVSKELEEKHQTEKSEFLAQLGIAPTGRVPASLSSQIRELEEEQKRRVTRAIRDGVDRVLSDVESIYRDGLVRKYSADLMIMNPGGADLADLLAKELSAAELLKCIGLVDKARSRLNANVAPLLALEALFVMLLPGVPDFGN